MAFGEGETQLNTWYYFILTWKSGEGTKLYLGSNPLDVTLKDSSATTMTFSAKATSVFGKGAFGNSDRPWSGCIDQIEVLDTFYVGPPMAYFLFR